MMDTGNECLTKMDKDTVYVSNSLLENDDSTSDFLLASGNECDDAKKSEVVMESDHDNSNDLNKENNEDTIQDPREGIEENSFKKTSVQSNTGNFNIEPKEIEKDTVKASESLHENFKKDCRNINENNSKFVGSSDNLKDSLVVKEKYKMKGLHDFNDDDHMSNVSPTANDNVKANLVENGRNGVNITVDDSETCNSKIASTKINPCTNNSIDSNSVSDDDIVHNVDMGEFEGSCNDDFIGPKEDKTVEEVSATSIISKEDTIEEEKEKCEDVKTTYPEEMSTKDGATELKLAKEQEESTCLHDHVNHMENKKENMPGSDQSVYDYSDIERQVKHNEIDRLEDKLNQLASNTESISHKFTPFIERKPDIGMKDMSDKESISNAGDDKMRRRLGRFAKALIGQQDKDNDNPDIGVYLSGTLSKVDPGQDILDKRDVEMSVKISTLNAIADIRRFEGRNDTSAMGQLKIVKQCDDITSLLPEERTTVVLRDRMKVLQRTREKNKGSSLLHRLVPDNTYLQKMFDARRHIDRWMQNLTLYKIVEISKIITKTEKLMNKAYELWSTEENKDLVEMRRQLRLKYDDLMKVEIDQLLVQMNKSILEELQKLSGEDKVWLHVKTRFAEEITEKRRRELFKAAKNFKTSIESYDELRKHIKKAVYSSKKPSDNRDTLVSLNRQQFDNRDTHLTLDGQSSDNRDTHLSLNGQPSDNRDTHLSLNGQPSDNRDTHLSLNGQRPDNRDTHLSLNGRPSDNRDTHLSLNGQPSDNRDTHLSLNMQPSDNRDTHLSLKAIILGTSKYSEDDKSECNALDLCHMVLDTKSQREQNSQYPINPFYQSESTWEHENRSRKQIDTVSVLSLDHYLIQGVDIVEKKTKTGVLFIIYSKLNKTRTTNAESELKNGETDLDADNEYKPLYMIYMHCDKVEDTLELTKEDYIKGMGCLVESLLNPLLTSERIHVNTSKQEIASKLDSWLNIYHKLAKNQRDFVMNVVCSEMFENALFTSNVENKRLGYTLIFTKERRMPIVIPIYEGGYIDEKDRDERLHNTEYSRYRQQLGDGSDSKTNHVTNSKERKQKESQQRKNF